jgi:glycosyltransferase involved in cell wall biosynthesis
MTPLPVLIAGDAASSSTGLGRIAAAVAVRADEQLKDICRIATLGYGGPGSRKFKFPQYAIEGMGEDFVIPNLPEVWKDWAGDEAGVILFIWDASRLGWFSRPNVMCEDERLRDFLTSAKINRWIYNPLDADGPYGRLAYPYVQSLLGFDRILAYGAWGEDVTRKSLGAEPSQKRDLASIPHGMDPTVFYSRDRASARANFLSITGALPLRGQPWTTIHDSEILIGTVATNQPRKDWGLWGHSCALFLHRYLEARFWVHIDKLEKGPGWSIPQQLVDHGLIDRTVVSLGNLSDNEMAQAYSACDLTLGIGSGEGFGYPLAESLYCGTPVIHGKYAGAVDYMPEPLLIEPIAYRPEGAYSCNRPVFNPKDWSDKMSALLGTRVQQRPNQLDWAVIWPRFEAWFRRGLEKLA